MNSEEISIDSCYQTLSLSKEDMDLSHHGLNTFLDSLTAIIHKRDFEGFINLLDRKVIVDYSQAMHGVEDFQNYWDERGRDELWKVLDGLMAMDGGYEEGTDSVYQIPFFQLDKYFFKGVTERLSGVTTSSCKIYTDSLRRKKIFVLPKYSAVILKSARTFDSTYHVACLNDTSVNLGYIATSSLYRIYNGYVLEFRYSGKWSIKVFALVLP